MNVPGCTDNNWHQFMINCDGKQVSVTAKPKVWKMITDDQQKGKARAVNLSLHLATNLTTASKIDQPLAPVHLNQRLSTLEKTEALPI